MHIAEGGPFDPAIISLLAKFYSLGREGDTGRQRILPLPAHTSGTNLCDDMNDNDYFLRLLSNEKNKEDTIKQSIGKNRLEYAKSACRHNFNVAKAVGLKSHAALWETLSILLPALVDTKELDCSDKSVMSTSNPLHTRLLDHSLSLFPTFPISLAADLIGSQLIEFLEKGDCQHFVTCCEVLRNTGLLSAATSAIPEIGAMRQREAYLVYIELLQKLELFEAANIILKYSADDYLSELNRKGSLLHITCSACGKELPDGSSSGELTSRGSWCGKCRKCVGLCTLCHRAVNGSYLALSFFLSCLYFVFPELYICMQCTPVLLTCYLARIRVTTFLISHAHFLFSFSLSLFLPPPPSLSLSLGIYMWCPICCHGGHTDCLKKWFAANAMCPAGCGHSCMASYISSRT